MKLASFDIFDTTLIRKCGNPENIFYLLAHKLYPTDDAKGADFLQWRKTAEYEAKACKPGKEITLEDIYNSKELEGFCEYCKEELIKAEKAIETENLIANPIIKETIGQKRKQGYTICFISDMYLDSKTLKNALIKEGCIQENENVYVSCEWSARKSNGKLYKKLKEKLAPREWEHYGDHPISDIKMAKRYKIKATKVRTDFNSIEKSTIPSNDSRHYHEGSILAGLSRAARIHRGNDAYITIAADLVAPIYIPYVRFVLKKAKDSGIKVLYFLSRDSYILYLIAEQLPHEGIELRYLFVSRKSLLLPYLHNTTAEKFLVIQDRTTIRYVKDSISPLGTSIEELKNDFGIEFDFEIISTYEQEKTLANAIFGSESKFLPTLKELARKKRVLLNGYFTQEKVLGNDTTAMVDVGWLGTTRLMINSILKEENFPETTFFYYGVRQDVLHSKYGRYNTYHSPSTSDTELTFLVENYFSAAPYKTTNGYSKNNNRYVPVMDAEMSFNNIVSSNCNICEWITKELAKLPPKILETMDLWEETAMKSIKDNIHKIDKQPFVESGVSRKLNIKEFMNVVFYGKHITLYDKVSIALTVPKNTFPFFWRIHRKSLQLRRWLCYKLHK